MPADPYAGIGSRRTPRRVLEQIGAAAAALAGAGWVLRTGGSPGADQAFYRGAERAGGAIELYLPCPTFQAHARPAADPRRVRLLERPSDAAFELASRHHPGWKLLDARERALRARDVHEVLGADLASPARIVICWTACGSLDGAGLVREGTGQALRVAHAHRVPVLNLARSEHARRMASLLRDPARAPRG